MKSKYYFLIFLTIFFFAEDNLFAQNRYSIKGIVWDPVEDSPVEFAIAALHSDKDSSFVKGVMADESGKFTLPDLSKASYRLSVSLLGYDTVKIRIPSRVFTKNEIVLDTVRLVSSDIMLSLVTVTAEPPELIVKEDTLEYNAAAFNMAEGAVVEDLLKRLPGLEVDQEGKITKPDGKSVRRVFVDGKEFFGNDPTMATKNLTTDMVDKIQVVDKKSDLALLTGVEDDEEETIINITIKPGMKRGWMGNVTSGLGGLTQNTKDEDLRYSENMTVNRFLENDQISFIANANNINGRGGGGGGITSANTLGINTAKIINEKMKFGGNVNYNYSDNNSINEQFRQNFLAQDSTSYRRSSSSNRRYNNNLSFNGKLEYQMDSSTMIVVSPAFSYSHSSSHSSSGQITMAGDIDSTKVNESTSFSGQRSNGVTAGLQVDVSRKLSAKGRRVSLSVGGNINSSSSDGTNDSKTYIYQGSGKDRLLDQQSNTDSDQKSLNLRVTYVEPVWTNNFLNFSYNVRFNYTDNIRMTYDLDENTNLYDIQNADYSKSVNNTRINHDIRMNFNSVRTNYSYNIGLNVSPNYTKSKSFIKDWYSPGNDSITRPTMSRAAVNMAPQLDFTYRLNNDKTVRRNLRFRYNGRMSQPTIDQLDPSDNNTNPLNIRTGNPDLLPSFNHNVSLRYNNNNREKQNSLSVNLNYTFTQNQIINYTSYLEGGIQHTQPINQSGSWNSSGNVIYSTPFGLKKRFKFSTQSNASFSNQIGYLNIDKQSHKNVSQTLRLSESLSLSYSNDFFYGQLRGRFGFSNTSNSISTREGQQTFNYNLSYNTTLTLPFNWSLSSDINYSANRGMSSGYNQDEVIWNAQVNKQIFRNKQGAVRLQVNDILQQRLNIRRDVSADYIQDIRTNAMTGYFMFSFSYRFNSMGRGGGGQRDRGGDGDSGGGQFSRGDRPSEGGGGRGRRF